MPDVFPFTLYCSEREWWRPLFSDFLRVKPKDMVWYAYDVTVESRTGVSFIVHDMLCNATGGIGKVIEVIPATVSKEATERLVEDRIMSMARTDYTEECVEKVRVRVEELANLIRLRLNRP